MTMVQWPTVVLSLGLVGSIPALGHAGAVVCAVTATPAKLSRFLPASDPSRFIAGATETCTALVGDTATAQQINLYDTVAQRYIKVVANATVAGVDQPQSMAEMTSGEKTQVDNALAAEAGKKNAWKTELNTPGVCKFTDAAAIDTKMAQIKANNDANIDAMTLSQADKDQLKAIMNRWTTGLGEVTTCDTARAGGG